MLKLTPQTQLHLTLKFLGQTAAERVDDIAAAGRQVLQGDVAPAFGCQGVGVFPPRGRPNVIWAGLTGAESLVRLAARLDSAMSALGYAPERRPFQPHLTLARVKGPLPRPLSNWLEAQRDTDFGLLSLHELVLFRSELSPTGAIHTAVAQWPLAST